MDADTKQTAKPRRRWLRFSLRTLLIVVTVLSVPLGWIGWRLREVRRERAVISWVEETGGTVSFPSRIDKRSWWEESTEKWFGERLRLMSLQNTPVSDVSPLAELRSLIWLSLNNTQVIDLSPLAELKNLELLLLHNTPVSDVSPLAELKNLEFLWLHNTQVSDVSPLAELKSLNRLSLDNTQVIDPSPLAELKSLEWLDLSDTQVSHEQMQELRQALPNCRIYDSLLVE